MPEGRRILTSALVFLSDKTAFLEEFPSFGSLHSYFIIPIKTLFPQHSGREIAIDSLVAFPFNT